MPDPGTDPASGSAPDSDSVPARPALPVTFRANRTRAVLLTIGTLMFAVITAVALLLDTLGPGERISFIFTALLFLCVLVLLARPKIVADETGVTVVNLTRVRRLEWAQIVRVNLRVGDPWVFLDLSDGTSLPVLAIQPGIAKQHAIRDARALRALAELHGTGKDTGVA